jgi:quercetin dioxygenase-like cupin family protein
MNLQQIQGLHGNYFPAELPSTHSEAIQELIKIVDSVPQLDIPVTHHFLPGVYAREITMPAGMTGVGHKHKTQHLNVVLTGRAIVTWDGHTEEIRAPHVFESMPGAQKAFQVIEDFRLMTVHPNPKNLTDIVEIEREIFDLPEEIISSAIPLDDFRMQKNQLK